MLELNNDSLAEIDTSFWVSASAGMGKTSILVKRALSLLIQNIAPNKILCITFTKVAAAEMHSRISKELQKWVFMNNNSLSLCLEELLGRSPSQKEMIRSRTLFTLMLEEQDSLKIQTIHSFCNQIIKKFSYELDLAPNFKLLDEAQRHKIFIEAKSSVYNQVSQSESLNEALKFITKYSSEHSLVSIFEELVINQYEFIDSIKDSKNMIEFLYQKFSLPQKEHAYYIENLFKTKPDYKKIIEKLRRGTVSDHNLANILSILSEEDIDSSDQLTQQYFSIFLTKEGEYRKKLLSKQIVTKYPELPHIFDLEQEKVKEIYDTIKTLKLIELSSAIITFGVNFIKELNIIKTRRGLIDYNDLISLTKNLLSDSALKDWVLYKLDYQIDHILVDEAQDTSPAQWDIIKNITCDFFSGESAKGGYRSLFIVGDEKQSIFSFQGASHTYFNEIFKYYQNKITMSDKKFVKKELVKSYRSSSSILKLVDGIFSNSNLKNKIAISSENIIHECHRINDFGIVELWPLIEDQDGIENYSQTYILAHQIVYKVKELLDRKILVQDRIIEPRDIIILVQKRSALISDLIKIASQKMIPISGPDKFYLTEEIAIQDLVSAANFALFPSDDLNLAALIRSPIIGASNEDLEKLCVARESSLWQQIELLSMRRKPYKAIYQKLKTILDAKYLPVYEFYSLILFKQNSMRAFVARFGEEVAEVINEFLNLTFKFAAGNIDVLQIFVKWITSSNIEIKRDSSGEENKVRILTIHGAKGLQAPVVILADAANIQNGRDNNLYIDKEIILWNGSAKYQNDFLNEKNKARQDHLYNEYIRLLYVALTRAENYLIITGIKNGKNLDEKSWYNIIKQAISDLSPRNIEQRIFYPDGKFEDRGKVEIIENGIIEYSDKTTNYLLNEDVPEYFFRSLENNLELTTSHLLSNPAEHTTFSYSPYESDYSLSLVKKGVIIHKILELISEIDKSKRMNFIDSYLSTYQIDKTMADEIRSNCIRVIEKYPEFFSSSLSEVKIGGEIELNGKRLVIFGRVDKISLTQEEVEIIDFKSTNRVPNDATKIDNIYLKQIYIYQTILNSIFKRNISSFLMWTSTGDLMKVPENMINKYIETARS